MKIAVALISTCFAFAAAHTAAKAGGVDLSSAAGERKHAKQHTHTNTRARDAARTRHPELVLDGAEALEELDAREPRGLTAALRGRARAGEHHVGNDVRVRVAHLASARRAAAVSASARVACKHRARSSTFTAPRSQPSVSATICATWLARKPPTAPQAPSRYLGVDALADLDAAVVDVDGALLVDVDERLHA